MLLAFGLGTLPNLLGIGLLWRRFTQLRRTSTPRVLAGGVVAAFGVFGLIKTLQDGAIAGDGLLCHIVPGFGGLLP